MASIPNIFEDPKIAELADTTVGEARADAPNTRVAHQVEENANLEHQAAEQAASVAKTKGRRLTGEMSTSVDKVRNVTGEPVKEPLDKAVEEGKRDVADIQAVGAEKLGQMKEMAVKATASAQEYFTSGTAQGNPAQGQESASSGGILPSFQGAASTVAGTASSTLSAAKSAAQSTVETAASAAQSVFGTAGTQGAQVKDMPASSIGIPATTAPLESGAKKLDTMYPAQGARDVGNNEPKSSN